MWKEMCSTLSLSKRSKFLHRTREREREKESEWMVQIKIDWLWFNLTIIFMWDKTDWMHLTFNVQYFSVSLSLICDKSYLRTNACQKVYLTWHSECDCLCMSHWHAIVNLWNIDFVCKPIAYKHEKGIQI